MTPEWDYFKIWEQTICLSDNVEELGLFLSQKEKETPENNQLILEYLKHIKFKTEETITLLNQ